ncbi:g3296 [Coccomyxa elongata]
MHALEKPCAQVLELSLVTSGSVWALKSLLGPKPTPVPLEQLADFLRDHSNRKLPVSRSVYEELVAVEHDFEEPVCPATGPVAAYMAGLIRNEFYTGGSVQNTVVNSQMYIGNVLWLLAKHAPHELQLRLKYDHDAATTNPVSSVSLLDGCQPSFCAVIMFWMMMFGEDKAEEMGAMEAYRDLQKKSVRLNPSTQCAFDTATPKHRAWLLLFVANIYRVLLSLSLQLPNLQGDFPDNHWQERGDGAAVMRMIGKDGSRSFVKRITIADASRTRERLQITDAAFDLVHTLGTNQNGIVKVLRRNSTRRYHTFSMTELGPDLREVPPSTKQEFKAVARSCLRGLETLHASGLAYHDPKEANTLWLDNVTRNHAVLCDLDTAGPLDADLEDVHQLYWDENTLDAGKYTQHKHCDLSQLALMLSRLSYWKDWEASSNLFREALKSRRLSARNMLQHAYLQS